MRLLWRISNHCDLSGMGGEKSEGRWHSAARGKRIVYLSEHPALALVEVLAGLKANPMLLPEGYQLMKVAVADTVSTNVLSPKLLSTNWHRDMTQTRSIGDSWLTRGDSALLGVPSAPAPESLNYLFSPLHRDASGLNIEWCKWVQYDKRLFLTRAAHT